jgi:hypothetical protein
MSYSGFISIKSVIDRVMRNPLCTDIPIESAIVWSVDVVRLIGSPAFLQHKIIRLGIEDYRCTKPEDMVFMTQARRVITPYSEERQATWTWINDDPNVIADYPEGSLWIYNSQNIVDNPTTQGEEYQQMYEATDPFHEFYDKSYTAGIAPTNSYKFNGNYVYTSFPTGTIDLAYDGIMLDNDGFPMIPNDPSVEKAIESYIKSQYFGIMADMGKDVKFAYERAEKEYCWYIGQSQSHSALMSLDKREALSNTMNTLMRNDKPHGSFYRNIGYPEKIRKQ